MSSPGRYLSRSAVTVTSMRRSSTSRFAHAAAFGAYVLPVKRTPMMKTPGASAARNARRKVGESVACTVTSPRCATMYRYRSASPDGRTSPFVVMVHATWSPTP
jgi:hypothetical protein